MHAGNAYYSGASVHPMPAHGGGGGMSGTSGFCPGCAHPRVKCCCWIRECRKESKELLVQATLALDQKSEGSSDALSHVKVLAPMMAYMNIGPSADGQSLDAKLTQGLESAAALGRLGSAGIAKAFIGGGCCVHLSIEYTPTNPASNQPALVFVLVRDSEGTLLAWVKQATAQDGYQIKEGIITTKPGAHVTVLVLNMTARVRWCEVFSC